jgi:hypothetical protein
LLATGETSRYDGCGDPRADFGLADLFGAHLPQKRSPADNAGPRRGASDPQHTYLRLDPGIRPGGRGGQRHPVLRGFEGTDILPFGGILEDLHIEAPTQVLLTFVPSFPVFPPESVWMREPRTAMPGLLLNERPSGGRVAFLPADLDRCYARDHLPDHANLLANLVRWTARDRIPLSITGTGLIDCHLYRQPGRLILHVVNLTNEGAWRAPIDELIPVGPFTFAVNIPKDVRGHDLRLLVSNRKLRPSGIVTLASRSVMFRLESILDHEVVVIS